VDISRIVTRVALGVLVVEAAWVSALLLGTDSSVLVATDYQIYRDAAARGLGGKGFNLPEQLGGPYVIRIGQVLYPPVILWLLVPAVYLPAAVWWLVPIGLTAFALWKLRPRSWAWLLIVVLCLWPRTPQIVIHGNPTMWAVAFALLAVLYSWPGPFVLVKPVLAPFALIGIRSRAWWAGLALFGLLCLPFGGMWIDWVRLTLDSGGATYALGDYVPMLIPLVAWAGRSHAADPEAVRRTSTTLPPGPSGAPVGR
jgi:hypothetical protein